MSNITVKVKGMKKLKNRVNDLGKRSRYVMADAAKAAGQDALKGIKQSKVIKSKAHLKYGFKVKNAKGAIYTVGFSKKRWYLKFFETGTKPHRIKGKPFLRLPGGARVRSVRHPGMKARPFVTPEIQKAEKKQKIRIIEKVIMGKL